MARHFDHHPPSAQANQAKRKSTKRPIVINGGALHFSQPKPDAFPFSTRDGDIRRAVYNALINAHLPYEAAEWHRVSPLSGGDALLQLAGKYANLNFADGAAAADEDEGDLGDAPMDDTTRDLYAAVLSAGEAA